MRVGCGIAIKEIRGRPYLYFWHYEERSGRRSQVSTYMGPARSPAARERLARSVEAYYERVAEELRQRRAEALARCAMP